MKQLHKINQFLELDSGSIHYTFLPSGDVFTIQQEHFLINQFRGNQMHGSANNLYLRIYKEDGIHAYPMLGILSDSILSYNEHVLVFSGSIEGISYKVTFCPSGDAWFWNVALEGSCPQELDVVYGQDLGVAEDGGVYANELYMSQYLGHSILEGAFGTVVCSRQNQPCGGCFPYVQQGTIGIRAAHYSTDGLQFFGLSYRDTNIPDALSHDLADRNLQYEFAYTALQTERFALSGTKEFAFYGIFRKNHPDKISGLEYQEELAEAFKAVQTRIAAADPLRTSSVQRSTQFGAPFCSAAFTEEEVAAYYPNRMLEECFDNELFSFFTEDYAHVVTKQKELHCERPHGTIVITPPDTEHVSGNLISSTQYMDGIFTSHVVIGNTNLHKFISTPRGFLDLFKNSGQRIWIRIDGTYRMLSVPGLYEMGMNYGKWFYKIGTDVLTVVSYTAADSPDLILELYSEQGIAYDFVLTTQLSGGVNEYESDITCEEIPHGLHFGMANELYPHLSYDILFPEQNFTLSDDRMFYQDAVAWDETFLTFSFQNETSLKMVIRGHLDEDAKISIPSYQFEEEKNVCIRYYNNLTRQFHLQAEGASERAAILNATAHWYAHNAMIHFSMPHGLEQPGGAAWGTRDICQGPFEFFLTTGHYALLREILLNIFSHQSLTTGEWAQWFMFDRYHMDAGECHGDVIFWPLKCVADYINACGDTSILSEELPYDGPTAEKATLTEHLKLALSNITETRFVPGTGLITYAGGDWDDTLQPAQEEMKKSLVSAWTQALAYQTFRSLADAIRPVDVMLGAELDTLAVTVKDAFDHLLIKDGVIAGFAEYRDSCEYLLHPCDERTGIHYRLLPMTRSIISELVDSKQAGKNIALITEHLKCPDGVRLMDKPANYDGGVSTLFKRAEQAANVGREISLQYTHAHIRYIESMAKSGNGEEAWNSLFTVNPILIQKSVPNARIRQSNMYFSSSEGAFDDRYAYARDFHLLKEGKIEVKGGWRLYSSGPGIYMRQLIANVLGIRFCEKGLILDPVISADLFGATFTYECYGRTLHFCYQHSEDGTVYAVSGGSRLPAEVLPNPYRRGGILLAEDIVNNCAEMINLYC